MPSVVKDDYVEPVFLTNEARDLNDRFYLLLNNLVAMFPRAKLKPDEGSLNDSTVTNKQLYDITMDKMLDLQSAYFMYKNDTVRASEDLLNHVASVDAQINVMDVENKTLKTKLNEITSSSRSTEGMLDDSQLTRNQLLYGNVLLLLVMSMGGFIYYKNVYKA